MKSKKKCHKCQKGFWYDKNQKRNLKYTKKLEIIVITLEKLEEQLIVFSI